MVEGAVVVGIGEEADASEGFFATFGVASHFDDEEAVVLVEGDGDGVDDEGFAGGELELEARSEFEGREGVGGWGGLDPRESVGGDSGIRGRE